MPLTEGACSWWWRAWRRRRRGNSRRRRREQSPSTYPALFLWGGGRGQRAARADAHTTHGRRSHNTNIFCKWEWETSPDLHSLILLAGDIEQNPGPPTYPYLVYHRAYSRRRGAVQCTVCLFVSTLLRNLTHKTLYTRLDLPRLPASNTTLNY